MTETTELGWRTARLDEVAQRVAEKNSVGHTRVMTVSAAHGLVDQEKFFSKRIASADLSGYWVVHPGDFVYNKSTSKDAPFGVVVRHEGTEPVVVTPLYFVFRPMETMVHSDYLLMACNSDGFFASLRGMLREGARAHGALNVRLAEFYGASLPLPLLHEQKRIIEIVRVVDAHLDALTAEHTALSAALERARLGLLSVGPRGDWATVETNSNTVHEWADSVPEGWRVATIGEVATVRSGATPKRSEHARYFEGGDIPWVKTGDLNERALVETDERITAQALAESAVRLLPANTVLVAMYGGFAQIGRTARLGVEATTNQALSALTKLNQDVDPEYLHEVLKAGRPRWRRVAAGSRKDPNITKRDVEGFEFPLPPRVEQAEIVRILAAMELSADAIESQIRSVKPLRRALVAALLARTVTADDDVDQFIKRDAGEAA